MGGEAEETKPIVEAIQRKHHQCIHDLFADHPSRREELTAMFDSNMKDLEVCTHRACVRMCMPTCVTRQRKHQTAGITSRTAQPHQDPTTVNNALSRRFSGQ